MKLTGSATVDFAGTELPVQTVPVVVQSLLNTDIKVPSARLKITESLKFLDDILVDFIFFTLFFQNP